MKTALIELRSGLELSVGLTDSSAGAMRVKLSRLTAQRLADALHAAAEHGTKAATFMAAAEVLSDTPSQKRSSVVRLKDKPTRAGVVYLDGPSKRRGVVKL